MADADIVKYYRERAGEYEQIYYRDNAARRKEIDDEVTRLASLVTGKTVLEIACGTGYWTEIMSRTAKSIVATDIAPEMVEEAKPKPHGCPVEFIVSDMNNLPTFPAQFDIVALGFWYSHHPRQNFEQLYAILNKQVKPDGKIWMIDNNPPAEGATHDSLGSDEFGNNRKTRRLNDGREFVILKNYFAEQELHDLLSPHYKIDSLVYGTYYWSTVLSQK